MARWQWTTGAVVGMVLGSVLACGAQRVTPVPTLDLTKFSGTWYEIARLPTKAEKKCTGDNLTLYALDDKANHFSVVNTCSLKDDTPLVRNDSGKRPKHATDGRLETNYFVVLHRKTWVLALDPNYQWAVVGSPNHKTLWVYSRALKMDDGVLADVKSRVSAQGFNVAKLLMTPQSSRPRRNQIITPTGADAGGAVR